MNWDEAVQAMLAGDCVRRKSEMYMRLLPETGCMADGLPEIPVYESGQEGCRILHAWTVDNRPVQVFVGVGSKCLFVPDDEQMSAIDWQVVERKDA